MKRRFGLRTLVAASLLRRKTRVLLAITALALGACVLTALITIYGGVQLNLTRQFRSYGANVLVTPRGNSLLSPSDVARVRSVLPPSSAAAGVLYGVVSVTAAGATTPIAIAGSDLSELLTVNPSWRVSDNPRDQRSGDAWIGVNAARKLHATDGSMIRLAAASNTAALRVRGTVESGTSEDNQVFLTLADAEKLMGVDGLTTIQIHAATTASALQRVAAQLSSTLPQADVRLVRQITETEGRVVLSTTGMLLASVALILTTIGLCVTAALAGIALERQRDFGIMRALGAGEASIFGLFLGEGVLLGIVAALIGYTAGAVVAWRISMAAFGVALKPGLGTFFTTFSVTVFLTVIAALAPWRRIGQATPATILKGE